MPSSLQPQSEAGTKPQQQLEAGNDGTIVSGAPPSSGMPLDSSLLRSEPGDTPRESALGSRTSVAPTGTPSQLPVVPNQDVEMEAVVDGASVGVASVPLPTMEVDPVPVGTSEVVTADEAALVLL